MSNWIDEFKNPVTYLLLEDGSYLLLETGDKIVLQQTGQSASGFTNVDKN